MMEKLQNHAVDLEEMENVTGGYLFSSYVNLQTIYSIHVLSPFRK